MKVGDKKKLTEEEMGTLVSIRSIKSALDQWNHLYGYLVPLVDEEHQEEKGVLQSWQKTYEYLGNLVEQDSQTFVNQVIRPRLKLGEAKGNDLRIDLQEGIVERIASD